MTALGKLFEIVQKDEVFNLEPEELAVALLRALDETKSDPINPSSIISFEWLKLALDGVKNNCTGVKPRSESEYDDILFILMEAWQWLVSEVLVAPRPTHLASSTTIMMSGPTYFITRQGKLRIKEAE